MAYEIEPTNLGVPEELTHYSYFDQAPKGTPVCDKARHDLFIGTHAIEITQESEVQLHKKLLMAAGVSPIDIKEIISGERAKKPGEKYIPKNITETPVPSRSIRQA